MTPDQVMRELEAQGTPQNRKIFARHGVTGPQFGVSYGNLDKLQKRIRTNHELAQALWNTGNHDARILALKIADPVKATAKLVDWWARACDNAVLGDAVSGYIAKTRFATDKCKQWSGVKGEFLSAIGWTLLSYAAMAENDKADDYFLSKLGVIERDIHRAPNRTRHAMNMALIAIGIRNAALEKAALETAGRIGKVDVDHGETSCTTPDAATYIAKARDRGTKRRVSRKVSCCEA